MNKQTFSKICIAFTSIILIFVASNEHVVPTYVIFGYIENIFGLLGYFVFFGISAGLIYLGLSKLILRLAFTELLKDALKVALVSYLLLLIIWSYIFFIFTPA